MEQIFTQIPVLLITFFFCKKIVWSINRDGQTDVVMSVWAFKCTTKFKGA